MTSKPIENASAKWITIKKVFGILGLIALSIPLLIYLCLLRSEKARYFLYKEINYQYLSDSITAGAGSEEEKILKIFDYIHRNMANVGEEFPDKDVWHDLVTARAVCDQQSWAFSTLLARQGIPARIAMLYNSAGISNHTVTEVLTKRGWSVFDPLTGMYFVLPSSGAIATMDDIYKTPSLFYRHPFYEQIPTSAQKKIELFYEGILKTPDKTVRWAPLTEITSSSLIRRGFNSAITTLIHSGGSKLVFLYQDFYLSCLSVPATIPQQVKLKLDCARNYDLLNRPALAEPLYQQIINKYPNTSEATISRFFLARLCINQNRFSEAETLLTDLTKTATVWKPCLRYNLSQVYGGLQQNQKASKLQRDALQSAEFLEVLAAHHPKVPPNKSLSPA